MSWMEHQEEPQTAYERSMREALAREEQRVIEVTFGTFDGGTLHCDCGDLGVGTVVANKTRYDSEGELYMVTRVGRSGVINERQDPTNWQEYGVVRIANAHELALVQGGFVNGWNTNDFYASHLSDEQHQEYLRKAQ